MPCPGNSEGVDAAEGCRCKPGSLWIGRGWLGGMAGWLGCGSALKNQQACANKDENHQKTLKKRTNLNVIIFLGGGHCLASIERPRHSWRTRSKRCVGIAISSTGAARKPRYSGHITASTVAPFFTGQCLPVPCPLHSSGSNLGEGCTCNAGHLDCRVQLAGCRQPKAISFECKIC